MTMVWVFIFYMTVGAVKIFKARSDRRRMIFRKIADLPLLMSICIAIFMVTLFVPMPNNTIINNSKAAILVTTHAHTEFSHDGLISQENIWKWHKKNGFDAFFITDHANHKKSLKFAQEQRDGKFPIAPLVMVGQEYSGSNHMSLLGINGAFETKGMHDKAVIDSVHRYGGAVIINHWFDGKGESKELYKKLGADGFEIENAGKDLYYDRGTFKHLNKFCKSNGLTMIGGLDFHGYGRVCSLYNAFEIPTWHTMDPVSKQLAILEILKNGPQEKVKVLVYKDRPFYTNENLFFRPFMTLFNYYRTLNLFQVLSWVFWLVLFQIIKTKRKKTAIEKDMGFLLFAGASAIFMVVYALVYYFRGEAVKGYSDLYYEYGILFCTMGLLFLSYVLAIAYFRFFKPKLKVFP